MNKWFAISLGTVLGVGHIGMIGLLANRSQFPAVNLPVGNYTSYTVEAGKDGYRIQYKANDPKVMRVERTASKPGGFLGLRKSNVFTAQEYTMDGSQHLEGRKPGNLSAKRIACIKAQGGGESTGSMVGAGLGAAAAPTGWATMVGSKTGSEIGGQMATEFADCDPDIIDIMEEK